MDVFDNCRICLETIIHEPIKMTRFVLKFIEIELNLKCVARQFEPKNVKLSLCAVCVNKLSDFQDFYEQLKESDEFWAKQFASDKQKKLEECMPDTEEEFQHDVDEIQAKECTPAIKQCQEDYAEFKQPEEFIQIEQPHAKVGTATHGAGDIAEPACEEPEGNVNIVPFEDVVHWPENNQDENEIEQEGRNIQPQQDVEQEIIEYEYELGNNDDKVESSQPEAPSSTVVETEFESINMNCEIDDIDESKSRDTPIQEMFEDVLGSTEPAQGQCDQGFVDNTYLETTTIDDSGKVKKSYQCQHCDRSFDRVYDIESHYNIHSNIKPFVCDVCGRSFRQKNILTTHQALHFGKKIECPECGKKYSRKSQLILHFRMHRDEKPFACDFEGCVAAFRQRQHLLDHLFIHTGEKNFQCSTCNKSFHTRKRLQDHVYKVHASHRYGCDMCNKAFLKPHMLKNHLLNIHNCEISDVSHLKVSVDKLQPSKKPQVDL